MIQRYMAVEEAWHRGDVEPKPRWRIYRAVYQAIRLWNRARGPESGASRALAEGAACLEHGIDVAFTIDGPRVPAYVAKAGAVTLARHTGQAILPIHITARRRIRLGSWDRLQIPVPFTRALAIVGEPIYVGRDAVARDLESKQSALQEALDAMREACEEWRIADRAKNDV
jgi:lysophospholipid acyltransferase (LPLAT)-like uncharacterized protein